MKSNYASTLESYLIPANEALDSKSKEKIAEIGIMAAIVAVLGISQKFKNRKLKKEQDAKNKANNEAKQKFMKEAFAKIDQKYNLSSMTEQEYKNFIYKFEDQLEIDLKKILKPLNSKENINAIKESYINDLKNWYKDNPNSNRLETEIAYAEKEIKPGLFKIVENCGQYICIIDGDQDINMACSSVVDEVAEALELKYSDFGDLCELAATEIAEIEKLWEELLV